MLEGIWRGETKWWILCFIVDMYEILKKKNYFWKKKNNNKNLHADSLLRETAVHFPVQESSWNLREELSQYWQV